MNDIVNLETLKKDLNNFLSQEKELNKQLSLLETQAKQLIIQKNVLTGGIQTLQAVIKRAENPEILPLDESV